MPDQGSPQLEMLKLAAAALRTMLAEVVFVGGATACLYVEAAVAEEMRPTEDVDCVIEVTSQVEYAKLNEKLRKLGLKNSTEKGAPICRWLAGDLVIDVMPTNPDILGFSNHWYTEGMKRKVSVDLGNGAAISIMPFPYFLASKLEAFLNRGMADPRYSKDLEDIVLVLDGHRDPERELMELEPELKEFFRFNMRKVTENSEVMEAVSASLPNSEKARMAKVRKILKNLSDS